MSDLFGKAEPAAPLAEAMRPQSLDDVVGQRNLLGAGKPLRLAFESGKPHSMILWGPPGSGKTTLARLMARAFDAEFVALSAVFSGVKDIREAMQAGRLKADGNILNEKGDVKVIMDSQSAPLLQGAEADYVDSVQGSGFSIKNPQAKTTCGCGSSFSA